MAGDGVLQQGLLDLMEHAAPGEHPRCPPPQEAWGMTQDALMGATSGSEGFNLFEFLALAIAQSRRLDTQTRQLLPLICVLGAVAYALSKASAELTEKGTFNGAKREIAEGLAQGRTATASYIAKEDLSPIQKHVQSPAEPLTGMQSAVEGVLAKWLGDSGDNVQSLMESLTNVIDGLLQQDASGIAWILAEQGRTLDLMNKFNLDLAANALVFGPRR